MRLDAAYWSGFNTKDKRGERDRNANGRQGDFNFLERREGLPPVLQRTSGGTTLRVGLGVTTERDFPSFYADCAIRPFIAERRGIYIRRESYKSHAAI